MGYGYCGQLRKSILLQKVERFYYRSWMAMKISEFSKIFVGVINLLTHIKVELSFNMD